MHTVWGDTMAVLTGPQVFTVNVTTLQTDVPRQVRSRTFGINLLKVRTAATAAPPQAYS